MNNSKTFTFLVLIALLCLSTIGNGQVIKHEIVLGNTISLESEVLNEERDFYVYLPAGYEIVYAPQFTASIIIEHTLLVIKLENDIVIQHVAVSCCISQLA